MVDVYISDVKNAIYIVYKMFGQIGIFTWDPNVKPIAKVEWGVYHWSDRLEWEFNIAIKCKLSCHGDYEMADTSSYLSEIERWLDFWDDWMIQRIDLNHETFKGLYINFEEGDVDLKTFVRVESERIKYMLANTCGDIYRIQYIVNCYPTVVGLAPIFG